MNLRWSLKTQFALGVRGRMRSWQERRQWCCAIRLMLTGQLSNHCTWGATHASTPLLSPLSSSFELNLHISNRGPYRLQNICSLDLKKEMLIKYVNCNKMESSNIYVQFPQHISWTDDTENNSLFLINYFFQEIGIIPKTYRWRLFCNMPSIHPWC